ncbi:DUF1553 domain-containing protein [Roseimaritima ulvae]|uniref:Planctomycete cytochrome C n=1 Tax=Roseimaritima ulvae TaxID=980254 RepID=A0A5B9QWI0_9BACT|nr:DUF1553 domain-containing protein [Roseimaritima ulvae]QEG43367.1 Planctomycete cytochrome C [Roseimaritima ulvae]
MRRSTIPFRFLVLALLTSASTTNAAEQPPSFVAQLAQPLTEKCVRCHRPDNLEGGLDLTTREGMLTGGDSGPGLVPGQPDDSPIYLRSVPREGEIPEMPEEGAPLTAAQADTLRRWIADDAPWPENLELKETAKAGADFWSLQPLREAPIPAVTDAPPSWQVNPIDRFIFDKLAQHELTPAPATDPVRFIRRLSFDLLGLPPSPQQVADFQLDCQQSATAAAQQTSQPGLPDEAVERLIDQLLARPQFGERWARHWLDIAHYADTHGFERDRRRDQAWPYRDYVIRSFNDDKPYDQFLREQIAGDVLAPDNPDAVIATGFLAAGPWDYVGQVETKSSMLRRAARSLDLDDMVTQVMAATVGMTVNCARCHDHKLDPITQSEYYELTAVFAGLRRAERDVSPTARQDYEANRTRIEQQLSDVAASLARLKSDAIDLADVVGGGDGYGTGKKGAGIDVRNGQTQAQPLASLDNIQPGHFATSALPFVDGVFVPAVEQTQITSSGLTADNLPTHGGNAWDAIRNGPVTSQFSTQLGDVDYATAGHSLLGLHANAGITFDLHAIRDTHALNTPLRFSTVVGYGGRTVEPSAEYLVLLDGELKSTGKLGRNDTASVELELPDSARFLTLIATDGGNGYSHDQISFGDPRLAELKPRQSTPDRQEQIAELEKRQQQLLQQQQENALQPPQVFFGVVAESPPSTHILIRGNPETPGEAVAPGTLRLGGDAVNFGTTDMPDSQRRIALADWITDPQNPLTARVIVNRLWHHHFGRGIVGTPSDFGYGGERPSHPELLDWLAAELIRADWSLKHIHRLIVSSQTYRMTSRSSDPAASQIDSDNHLLWRMNARRLEAEAIRDAVLVCSGKLNPQMYGPGYRDFDYHDAYAPIYTYQTADAPPLWRRSIYRFTVRTTPQPFLSTLDCPDPATLTPSRNVTTTALQSLALFNNDFMLRQSQYFAQRLADEAASVDEQIRLAFQLVFARAAAPEERAAARQLVDKQGLQHLCRVLLNTNEFVTID